MGISHVTTVIMTSHVSSSYTASNFPSESILLWAEVTVQSVAGCHYSPPPPPPSKPQDVTVALSVHNPHGPSINTAFTAGGVKTMLKWKHLRRAIASLNDQLVLMGVAVDSGDPARPLNTVGWERGASPEKQTDHCYKMASVCFTLKPEYWWCKNVIMSTCWLKRPVGVVRLTPCLLSTHYLSYLRATTRVGQIMSSILYIKCQIPLSKRSVFLFVFHTVHHPPTADLGWSTLFDRLFAVVLLYSLIGLVEEVHTLRNSYRPIHWTHF